MLDDVDGRFVIESRESKSTPHGRCHDVYKKEGQKTANFSRTRGCLKLIRSAATVYNRVRFARKMQHTESRQFRIWQFRLYGNMIS